MHHFDELSKDLAAGMTRRQALRRVGGGLAGALLASFGLSKALAGGRRSARCVTYCRDVLGIDPGNGNAFGKCVSNCANCIADGGIACGAGNCCTDGESCTSDANGTCAIPCVGQGGSCEVNSDCCPGLSCFGGTCTGLVPA